MNAGVMPRASGSFAAQAADRSSLLAGALSVLVHGGLVLALMLGVSWRNTPNQPVQAEIWTNLPEPALLPRPERVVEAPPKAPPKPPPKMEPPIRKPDIALKPLAKPPAKPATKPKTEPKPTKASPGKAEQKKLEARKREEKKREEARRALEQELMREEAAAMEDELAQVQAQVRAQRQRAEARARTVSQLKAMAIRDAQDRIRLKIRGLLRIPEGVKGNPEVVYRVRLFPNGEIMGQPERVRSSGQPAYDAAVETAILKASPLPLPTGAEVAADFRDGLELRFRPREE